VAENAMKKTWPAVWLTAITWLVVASPSTAQDEGHAVTLWRVAGAQNTVYLLGTIHALRKSDYPLPTAIDAAYDDADALFMELDMDDLDPIATQALVHDLGMLQDGQSLSDILGPELFNQASEYATEINIPLAMLGNAEPWLAAMTIENLLLDRLGFEARLGIEMHLLQKAREDGKSIYGLETELQQMQILDALSPQTQKDMLLQTLSDGADMLPLLDDLIDAWRHGDAEQLAADMLGELEEHPELLRVLVSDRNLAWLVPIEELLQQDKNYLVAVGALHLVGDIGVPTLLQARDYEVVQVRQPDE
jgi:uncharacterized protein YbaP (TraB family)